MDELFSGGTKFVSWQIYYFSLILDNDYDYRIYYRALFRNRIYESKPKERCEFLIKPHRGQYNSEFYDKTIILGAPFFEHFYLVFDYDQLTLTISDNPPSYYGRFLAAYQIPDQDDKDEDAFDYGHVIVIVISTILLI
jgi:hypothetical protein